jgi:proteic killer suppression protein
MIKSFKHKGVERFFIHNDRKLLSAEHWARISRLLDRLDSAELAEDMRLPGYGLHRLQGSRKNTWGLKVSGNWRMTFRFEGGHAYDIDLEDYH